MQIHNHDVIYRFLDGVKAVMSELLPPEKKETVIGEGKTLEVSFTTLQLSLQSDMCYYRYHTITTRYCL